MSAINFWGTDGQYKYLHRWVGRQLGKPSLCESCGATEGFFEWANKSGKYLKEITDWVRLCRRCHRDKDVSSYIGYKTTHCRRGHEFTASNTRYERIKGKRNNHIVVRRCVECKRSRERMYYATTHA